MVKITKKMIRETKRPSGYEWIYFGLAIEKWMAKNPGFTQAETAKFIGIPLRRLQSYLAVTNPPWSEPIRKIILANADSFNFTAMDKITRRKYKDPRPLKNTLKRHLEGKPERKPYTKKAEKLGWETEMRKDQLREKYKSRVTITDQTIELHHSGIPEQEERLIEELLQN